MSWFDSFTGMFGSGAASPAALKSVGDIGFGPGNLGPGFADPSAGAASWSPMSSGSVAPIGDIGFGAGNIAPGWADPATAAGSGSSWLERNGTKVAAALKGLKAGTPDEQQAAQKDTFMAGAHTQAYPSRGNAQIDALVQMLQKRREALLAAAQGGQGTGQPVRQPISTGLLGF